MIFLDKEVRSVHSSKRYTRSFLLALMIGLSVVLSACAGVEINILTFVGPQVAEPLQRRGPDFTKLTGAKVNVVTVPNSELYQKALADLATGTNSYDGFLFAPSWIVDFAPAGYLEDLTDRVKADKALQWDDIVPFFQNFNSYQG